VNESAWRSESGCLPETFNQRRRRLEYRYMNAAIEQLKLEGCEVEEDDVRILSAARNEHINMYGKYYFNIEEGLKRKELRELRKPSNHL
jgi:hypothetical protein